MSTKSDSNKSVKSVKTKVGGGCCSSSKAVVEDTLEEATHLIKNAETFAVNAGETAVNTGMYGIRRAGSFVSNITATTREILFKM
jgi:hypothetical protein